jgi:hypothetical protein
VEKQPHAMTFAFATTSRFDQVFGNPRTNPNGNSA